MSSFLNPLLRRALTSAAGSAAAGKIGQQISQQASELTGRGPSNEDRTRFLVWLRGDFRARQPAAFGRIWAQIQRRERWLESDGAFDEYDLPTTLAALTAIWLQLQADQAACDAWFRDLGAADDNDFATLMEAVQPKPSQLQQNVESAISTASQRVRKYDPATPEGQRRVAEGAKKARALSDQLFGKSNKRNTHKRRK